jgi:hypothetical protein
MSSIKDKIRALEEELGEAPTKPDPKAEMTFRDSAGNETYYVKNVSGRHVMITDVGSSGMDKIPVGEVMDLTRLASLEDLKKSRDLRTATMGIGEERTLKRLTEEEFYEEKRKKAENKRKLDIIREQEDLRTLQQTQNPAQNVLPHERPFIATVGKDKGVRPAIKARLGKLALRNDPDPQNARQAMTSIEFIQWVHNEPLLHSEIDYIMGDPVVVRDHDIRAALLEKKQNTPPE